jgi:hypothetical protein
MSYVLPLPDGTNIAIREGETDEQAWRRAQQTYPEAFGITPTDTRQREVPKQVATPEGGFVPAVKAGFRNLAGDTALTLGKAGIIDPATAEKYRAEQEEAARGIFKPTEDDWATSPWQKLKETAGQSLPYMAAPLAAGAGAAALGAPALAAAGAAGLASTGVFTGSNLARQVDTGKTLEQTSGSDAFMAAIPQAALDMVSFRMIPGIGKIFGAAGEKITEASAKQIAEQTLKQAAKDYALKTGKAMTAEGLTETAQQVLERLQAGLALDDPEARKEYFESFVGGAALAGPLGAGGRFVERGQIKAGGEQMRRDRIAKEAETAAADEKARREPGPMPLQGPMPLYGPPAPPPQPRHPTEVAADVARLNGIYEQHQQALSDANEAGDFDRSQQISDAMGALDAQRAALAGELKESANSPGARKQEAVRVLEKVEADLRRQTGPGTDPAKVRVLLERRSALIKFLQENGDPRVEGQEQFGGREQDLRAAATQQGVPNTAPREELSPEELLAAQNRDAGGNPMAGYEASMGDVADAQEQVATQRKVADEAGALSRMGQKPVTPMFTDVFGDGSKPPTPRVDASAAIGRTGLDLKLHKLASVRNEAWTALEKLRGEMNNLPPQTLPADRNGLQRRLSAAYLRHEALDKNFQAALKKQQETELQPIGGGPREGGPSEAAKRVPGAQLVLREKNENAGVDRASVQTRLDEALNREDLSPAARGLLERLSNVGLPASDNTGVLSMVDKQLSAIESGQEGVVAPGPNDTATTPRGDVRGEANTTNGLPAYKNQLGNAAMRSAAPGQAASTAPVGKAKEEARADTAGTAPAAQRAAVPVQETVARANAAGRYKQTGDEADARAKQAEDAAKNARAKPLHAAADLEAHVGMLESMAEPNVKQGSLFNDEPVTQRATPKTFQRFLDSKHVAALRKVIDDAKTAYTRAGNKAVELRKKADALLTQAIKMHVATGEHRAAERVLKSHGGLKALKAAADRLRSVATDVVVENMSLQGEIDTLQTEHAALSRDFINASSAAQEPMGVMGGAANAAMADNVKKLQYEIETQQDLLVAKQADAAALKLAMNALDKNLAVLQLRDNRAALREAAATPAELEQAGQDLRAAEKEATVAEEEFRKLKVDRDAQDAANRQKTRREQGAAEDAERAAAWKKRDEFMQTVREIMGQFDPEAKTHVRALHSLERAHREGAAPPAGLYFDKELKWLKTEIGKVEKQIADVEKEVRASRTKANTMGREGVALVGPRARLVAALSRKLNALEEAYDYKAATEGAYTQVGGVEPAKRTVVKGSIVDDKLEQAQAHGVARDRMLELQDTLREAKKKGRIPKAKLAALEEKVAAAEAEEKELREGLAIEGAVTQVARVDSAAPAKLRTGSPESRANPGAAKRPLVEARNTATPTAAAAIEEGNRVSEARNAEAEPLTAEQEQVVAEEQQAELLHTTDRREETLRKQLADARASVAALRESIKYNKAVTPDTIQRKVDEAASIERELKAVRKELDRLLGPAAPDTDTKFSRGAAGEGSTKASLAEELRPAFGDISNKVHVVETFETVDDLLKAHPALRGEIKATDYAFVKDGKAYMIAENTPKGHALGIFLHEVGSHIGFRNIFNPAQYNAIFQTVRRWSTLKDNSVEARIGRAAAQRVKDAKVSVADKADEYIAYAIEEAVKAGVNPSVVGSKSPAANWLRRVVVSLKKVLAKFQINPENISVQELVNMAHGAAHLELHGTWHGTGNFFQAFDLRHVLSGEGTNAFGWGIYRGQRKGTGSSYRILAESRKEAAFWESSEGKAILDSTGVLYEGRSAEHWATQNRNSKPIPGIPPNKRGGFVNALKLADALRQDAVKHGSFEVLHPSPYHSVAKLLEPLGLSVQAEQFTGAVAGAQYKGGSVEQILRKDVTVESTLSDIFYGPSYDRIKAAKNTEELRAAIKADLSVKIEKKKQVLKDDQNVLNKIVGTAGPSSRIHSSIQKIIERRRAEIEETRAKLKELQDINVDDFTFEAVSRGPEVETHLRRVLSTESDDKYLNFERPLSEQSKSTQTAFKNAIGTLTTEQRRTFSFHANDYVTGATDVDGDIAYRALSEALGSDKKASLLLARFGVAGNMFYDHQSRKKGVPDHKRSFNYVDFKDGEHGAVLLDTADDGVGPSSNTLFSRAGYANDRLAKAVEDTKGLIATKRTFRQAVMDNLNGTAFDEEAFNRPDPAALPEDIEKLRKQHEKLDTSKLDVRGVAFRTQAIDALDPIQRIAAAMKDSLKASQMMFDLRSYGQRMNFTAQAVLRGGLTRKTITRADGRHEYVYEAGGNGGGLKPVVDILKDAPAGTGDATNQLFSRYLVAKRAANVGLDKMDLGGSVTQAHLDEVMAAIKATPGLEKVFERAAAAYHVHNASLLRFAEQTGAISKEEVDRLISQGDYVPYYRQRDGIVTLVLGTETPIRIGSLKEQPHLKKLVGGDQPILDFMTSAVQNTHLLTDMALRNQATKDVAINLAQMGLADINNKANQAGPNVVHFYHEGKERTARIDTEAIGIPADVLVRGMEGIATTLPGILKVFGMGSQLLRRSITASPLYMVRQLFRDSIAATFVSGTSLKTPLAAIKQIGRNSDTKDTLELRGVTGGQIFTGTTEDISNILGRLTSGKGHFMQLFHKLEQGAMEADAATRRAQFQSYRAQGLSEMESTMMALESMNFSRRGSSASVHAISQLIPFFNAQIQGLDVLWRAAHGTMPFNERLEIQKKLLTRGAMLAGMSMIYAMAMQDDEAYQNANPEEKYSNWFVRLPGVDQTVRLPVPFEIGYIFKSLPEAMVNMVMNDGTEDAKQAFGQILKQTIPGGTSMGVPQLVRPGLENALNKSFFTGRDLISPAEARLQPAQQYRDNTSETAKAVGAMFGLSPIKIENLVRGYTGGMGMALIQVLGMPFEGGEQGGKASKRLSDMPLIGTAFQPDDAGGIINRTYERVKEIQQAQATFNDMLKRGNRAQAAAFLQANAEDISKASFANSFPQMMADLAKAEAAVKASALSPAEKRERLDALRQRKIMLAKVVRGGLAGS